MNLPNIITPTCSNALPPPDPRCSDPAFALANPAICGTSTRLILKPSVAILCQLSTIQFRAFTVQGGTETDVTSQTTFTSSDFTIASIGLGTGSCAGIAPGEVTITATYLNFVATGQLTVLSGTNCCTQEHVAMMLMVDTTASMALGFGSGYSTKLDYAKAAAERFISEVNATKDSVGLMAFHGTHVDTLAPITSNTTVVEDAADNIVQSQDKTEFYDAVTAGIAALNSVVSDQKVLVIISDGADTLTTNFTSSNDPLVPLANFKTAGGIVIVLGVRAAGTGFALLSQMATGGFFINGYASDAADALNFLSGLKGYICAGNCTPTGDIIIGEGQLAYNNFLNWNVIGCCVDLQGNGFIDYLPGNGLYVDLRGTGASQYNAQLESKNTFALISGETYRITVRLAGNQIAQHEPDSVRVQLYSKNPNVEIFDQTISISDAEQGFQNYSFTFTANASYNAFINVQQTDIATVDPNAGVLLKEVKLENVSTLVTMFDDNFNQENQTYIPPACGTGTHYFPGFGYYTGYNCYGVGCLTNPPPTQLPDPNPTTDIESGAVTPPTTYTSTQTVCLHCSTLAPDPTQPLIPCMTSNTAPSGVASASSSQPASAPFNAFACGPNGSGWQSGSAGLPQYVQYQFPAQVTIAGYTINGSGPAGVPLDWTLMGSNDGTTWTVLDVQKTGVPVVPNVPAGFIPIAPPGPFTYYRFTVNKTVDGTNATIVLLQLFGGTNGQVCATKTVTGIYSSQQAADADATAQATAAAQAMLVCLNSYTSTQQATVCCPVGSFGSPNCITKSSTATSLISQNNADAVALANATLLAQTQLNTTGCNGDNSSQNITINDATPVNVPSAATPYPSVKRVSGGPASITKVQVKVNNLTHLSEQDIFMLLMGPDGTTCMLMARCGAFNGVSGINLTFDDTGIALPQFVAATSGTYRPTQYGAVNNVLPPPVPQSGYGTTLSVFNGKNANGSWSLWICDTTQGDSGTITGVPPWTLVIT